MSWDVYDTEVETITDRPESSEEAFRSLLNGVLNHGCKTVTALALDGAPRPPSSLYAEAMEEAGWGDTDSIPDLYDPQPSTLAMYCRESFLDIGLVAQEEVTEAQHPKMEGASAYRQSAFGRNMKPILAYTAKSLHDADQLSELYTVLGATHSAGESRSPFTRAKILYEIATGASTMKEIATAQNLDRSQWDDVKGLEENNIIERINPIQGGGQYFETLEKPNPRRVDSVESYAALTQDIVDILEPGTQVNAKEVAENLDYGCPSNISGVLWELSRREDFIQPVDNFRLTERGGEAFEILDDIACAVNRYMAEFPDESADSTADAVAVMPKPIQSVWQTYTEALQEFRQTANQRLWIAGRAASPHVNRVGNAEGEQRVAAIVESHDHLKTSEVTEIWNELFPHQPRRQKSIGTYLRNSANVERVQSGRENVWSYHAS